MKENNFYSKLNYLTATNFFLVAVLICTVSLYLFVSYFNYFSLDDYYFANLYKKEGVLKAVEEVYMLCGGRYTSSTLLSITPLSFGNFQTGAMYVSIFVILFFVTSLIYFFNTILSSNKSILSLTGLFLFAYLSHIPTTSEAIFWAAGSLTYTTGASLFLLFFAFLIKFNQSKNNKHLLLSALCYILTIGTNETILIICDLSFGAYFIHELIYATNNRWKKQLLFLLLIGISFSLIEILAPGNFERTKKELINVGDSTPKMDLNFALIQNFIFLKNIFIEWNKHGFLLLLFFSSFIMGYFNEKINIFTNRFNVIIFLPILFLVMLYISSIPTYYTFGFAPPRRTQNALYFFTIFFFIFYSFLLSSFIKKNKIFAKILTEKTKYLVPISVILFVGITGLQKCNIKYVLRDYLNGSYSKLKTDLNIRYKQLETANLSDTLFLENLSAKPEMLFHGDITPDPAFWTNMLFCDYFKLRATKITPFIRPTKWGLAINFDSEIDKNFYIKEGPQMLDTNVSFTKPASCLLDSLNQYSINLKINLKDLENKFNLIDGLCVDFKAITKGNYFDFSSIMLLSNPTDNALLDRQEQLIYSKGVSVTEWSNKKVYFEFTNKQVFKKENYVTLYFWNRSGSQLNIDDIKINFY